MRQPIFAVLFVAWGLLSYIISDAFVLHCWLGCPVLALDVR